MVSVNQITIPPINKINNSIYVTQDLNTKLATNHNIDIIISINPWVFAFPLFLVNK